MKSPSKSKLSQSPQSSKLSQPKHIPTPSRVSSFSAKHKLHKKVEPTKSCDSELQSTDKRRNYMRRGSKTPMMLLMNASHDMEMLGRSILPQLEIYDRNVKGALRTSYAALNTTALSLAAAVDILPEPFVTNSRMRRASSCWMNGENSFQTTNITPAMFNVIPEEQIDLDRLDKLSHRMYTPALIKPRNITAVTAIQEYLEKVSISNHSKSMFTCNSQLPMKNKNINESHI